MQDGAFPTPQLAWLVSLQHGGNPCCRCEQVPAPWLAQVRLWREATKVLLEPDPADAVLDPWCLSSHPNSHYGSAVWEFKPYRVL